MPDSSKIALIIGIDSYYIIGPEGNPSLEQLPSCKKDAVDIAHVLSSDRYGYTLYGNVPIIGSNLNKETGYVQIQHSISRFFNDAEINQLLLFYFSGHGLTRQEDNEIYLATPQVDPKEPMFVGVALSDLTKLVNSCKAMRIICMVDACYSGAVSLTDPAMKGKGAEEIAKDALPKYDRLIGEIPKTRAIWYFLSSQAYQRSIALENSNSLYTKYLLAALTGIKPQSDKNGDPIYASGSVDYYGDLTPLTLSQYIYAKVASEAPQIPGVKFEGSYSSPVILAKFPELASNFSEVQSGADEGRALQDLLLHNKVEEFNRSRERNPSLRLSLAAMNLSFKNLKGINLSGTDLTETNLSGSNLIGAKLVGANLHRATLHRANLSDANLTKAYLNEAELIGSNLPGVNLSEATLKNANLLGANLQSANVNQTDLTSANLRYSDVDRVNLQDANLKGADLRNAKNSSISKREAKSKGAIVQGFLFDRF